MKIDERELIHDEGYCNSYIHCHRIPMVSAQPKAPFHRRFVCDLAYRYTDHCKVPSASVLSLSH